MKILEFSAENVKRLKVATIVPKGNVVQVTGKNGQGKSSVLDAIYYTLAGEKHVDDEPLRRGAERGHSRLDLGGFIVERVFRKSGTTELTVRDGSKRAPGKKDSDLPKYGSPQELLDGLLGQMTFDPLAFSRMKPREQFEELRRIAKVSIDIDALEAQNNVDFEKRTKVNKDVKALRARVLAMAAPDERPTPVDESAIVTEMQNAAGHNTEIEKRKMNRETAANSAKAKREAAKDKEDSEQHIRDIARRELDEIKSQIKLLEQRRSRRSSQLATDLEHNSTERTSLIAQADDLDQKLANAEPLPEPTDVSAVRSRLDEAKKVNALVLFFDERKALADELETMEREAESLTTLMAEREKQRKDAITSADMPIEGLSLSDGKVFFNGFPFSQASDAERLRVSAAIGMAGNPEIRVMRIKDGGLLDEDGLKLLEEMAREKDWQVWIEKVDSSGMIGLVLVDGEVASDNQEEPVGEKPDRTVNA